jgi:hypothetical protein
MRALGTGSPAAVLPITERSRIAARSTGAARPEQIRSRGFFSIFKRGMKGVYQHCAEKHLHRYLAEFDFRYSNRIRLGVDDVERTRRAIVGAGGKRLIYRRTRGQQECRPDRLSRSGQTVTRIAANRRS